MLLYSDLEYQFNIIDQKYLKQELPSGCAVHGGKFHQRCVCNMDVKFCEDQCDASKFCKGYVGPVINEVTETSGCQLATVTDECPENCSLVDRGNGVDEMLTRAEKAGVDGYPGCHIKRTRNYSMLSIYCVMNILNTFFCKSW